MPKQELRIPISCWAAPSFRYWSAQATIIRHPISGMRLTTTPHRAVQLQSTKTQTAWACTREDLWLRTLWTIPIDLRVHLRKWERGKLAQITDGLSSTLFFGEVRPR